MGLKDLMKASEAAKPKPSSENSGPRLKWIDMSSRGYTTSQGVTIPSNRGSIDFLPIQDLSGVDIKYAYDCFKYLFDNGERNVPYFVMDAKDYEKELTDEEKAMIAKLRSLMAYFIENINGFPDCENKNYALMFGYVLSHISNDGTEIIGKSNGENGTSTRTAALLIFPSKNVAAAMTVCTKDMMKMGEDLADEVYSDLFSRNPERNTYLTINFDRPEGSFGYECTIGYKQIDKFSARLATPEEIKEGKIVIPEEQLEFCKYLSSQFFAGNSEELNDFDLEYATKVADQIQTIIDATSTEQKAADNLPPLPNKNKRRKDNFENGDAPSEE